MKVLFVGHLWPGSTSRQRRAATSRLGHAVTEVDIETLPKLRGWRGILYKIAIRFGYFPDLNGLSRRLLQVARATEMDVIWLDKVLSLRAWVFEALRREFPACRIIFYNPDDFKSGFNWSKHYDRKPQNLDLIVTTKSYNVPELKALGHNNVLFVNNSFDPEEHAPPPGHIGGSLRSHFDYDIGFVGGYERERAESIFKLAERGLKIHVTGSFWDRALTPPENIVFEHGDLGPGDYARRIFSTKINLAFLRKQNRDLQTTRSFEIPACGGFMLSEYSTELAQLFTEGVHVAFFCSDDDLYNKCLHYLAADFERETLAQAGCAHVRSNAWRSDDVVSTVLAACQNRPHDQRPAAVVP